MRNEIRAACREALRTCPALLAAGAVRRGLPQRTYRSKGCCAVVQAGLHLVIRRGPYWPCGLDPNRGAAGVLRGADGKSDFSCPAPVDLRCQRGRGGGHGGRGGVADYAEPDANPLPAALWKTSAREKTGDGRGPPPPVRQPPRIAGQRVVPTTEPTGPGVGQTNPPAGPPVLTFERFTHDGEFWVDYDTRGGAELMVDTKADSVSLMYGGDIGEATLCGEPAEGRTPRQIARGVIERVLPGRPHRLRDPQRIGRLPTGLRRDRRLLPGERGQQFDPAAGAGHGRGELSLLLLKNYQRFLPPLAMASSVGSASRRCWSDPLIYRPPCTWVCPECRFVGQKLA